MGEHPSGSGGSGVGSGAHVTGRAKVELPGVVACAKGLVYRADDWFLLLVLGVVVAVPTGAWAFGTFLPGPWWSSLLITVAAALGAAWCAPRAGRRVLSLATANVTPRRFLPGRMRQCLTCFFDVKPSG